MKDQFVNHTQALALKELGYSEYSIFGSECSLFKSDGSHTFYMNGVGDETYTSAPLKSQVFRWFRKDNKLLSWIFTPFGIRNGYFHEIVNLSKIVIEGGFSSGQSGQYDTYEEAESACIDKLIEIKNKLNDLERSN